MSKPLADHKTERIKQLLSQTDLSIEYIALRMGCNKSTVIKINRKFGIRNYYAGRRTHWKVGVVEFHSEL